ncbi:uncharacterized protein METZ01_LOCUS153302 [marine metagenome]|uniref:Abasic site processing protein n=1 Tax=marine metagenome TaxID=408172 RepID=A0A382AG13_9ZZZZ
MCGRKTLTKNMQSIIEELAIDEWENSEDYSPSYNIAPGQTSPIVIQKDQRIVKKMKWGLVPSWSKDETIGYKMINARSETLTEKPSYQGLISKHRCVVISDGYYEWKREGKRRIPYYIFAPEKGLIPMAGLWSSWTGPEGNTVNTYTVITTEAKTTIRTIHHRMPVILNEDTYPNWLNTENVSVSDALFLLQPYAGNLTTHPVSTLVNSPKNNLPVCTQPADNRETLEMF